MKVALIIVSSIALIEALIIYAIISTIIKVQENDNE